jgi:cysteine desulfurase
MTYFDNNATTPLGQIPLQVYKNALEEDWSNPSSPYLAASRVRAKMEKAREELADSLKLKSDDLIFTSGATESNNAVFAHAATLSSKNKGCLLSPIEHSSILEPARHWFGNRVFNLPVDSGGRVLIDDLEKKIEGDDISLVSLMAANNETGVLQPWQDVARVCAQKGVFFHCDATQWVGKIDASEFSCCTSFSASGHKFSGPKGVGWLACTRPFPLQRGGEQENGWRGGTENYPSIASMFSAFTQSQEALADFSGRASWRDQFEINLLNFLPDTRILGKEHPRLWNTSMLVMPKFESLSWIGKLDKLGFSVSTGSACSTGSGTNTQVASAMNLSVSETRRLIRISSYSNESAEDWQNLNSAIEQTYTQLEKEASSSSVISL